MVATGWPERREFHLNDQIRVIEFITQEALWFRQIHLDFHTSPHIPGIGNKFGKRRWQETLQTAAVEAGVNARVYLSAGVDYVASSEHPE